MPDDVVNRGALTARSEYFAGGESRWILDCTVKVVVLAVAYGLTGGLGLLLAIPHSQPTTRPSR